MIFLNTMAIRLHQVQVRRLALRHLSCSKVTSQKEQCKILVVGGGSGGCAMAAKLSSKFGENHVIVLEPAEYHYYQPMFTLIGGGMKRLEQSYRPMASVLPKKAKWIQEKAVEFEPKSNCVTTSSGRQIVYDILLIATGLQLNFDKIPGLQEALDVPNSNVCSIYSPQYVEHTYEATRHVRRGNCIFTYPSSPVKCPGAPQKIVYVAENYFRRMSRRKNVNLIYNTSLPVIFGVKHYADALWKVVEKRNIKVNLRRNLIEVRPKDNVAVFQNLDKPEELHEEEYSLLHAVPPMSTPKELSNCQELVDQAGFVNVDKSTLQHVKYRNVFAIGDCSNTPNSKTAAAAAAQSPVVFNNIRCTLQGKDLRSVYDGYGSCPLVTGYNKVILAEFDYNLTPLETFPIRQDKERYSMFFLKSAILPAIYWNVMLPGYWNGPALFRNLLSVFKSKKRHNSRK